MDFLKVFVFAELMDASTQRPVSPILRPSDPGKVGMLFGQHVAGFMRVNRNVESKDRPPFYVAECYFSDLNIRWQKGSYVMQFTAWAFYSGEALRVASVKSKVIEVYNIPDMGYRTKEEELLKESGARIRGQAKVKSRLSSAENEELPHKMRIKKGFGYIATKPTPNPGIFKEENDIVKDIAVWKAATKIDPSYWDGLIAAYQREFTDMTNREASNFCQGIKADIS